MKNGLNKVQIIGNLGKAPEMRYTAGGKAVTSFSVAVGRSVRGADGNQREETEWFRCVAWEKLAETCNQYLRKGSQVYIEGRLQTRTWKDDSGQERRTTEVVVEEMLMLGTRPNGGEQGPVADGADDEDGDMLPF